MGLWLAAPGPPTRGGDGMVDAVPLPSTAASADLILDKALVAAEGRACPSAAGGLRGC